VRSNLPAVYRSARSRPRPQPGQAGRARPFALDASARPAPDERGHPADDAVLYIERPENSEGRLRRRPPSAAPFHAQTLPAHRRPAGTSAFGPRLWLGRGRTSNGAGTGSDANRYLAYAIHRAITGSTTFVSSFDVAFADAYTCFFGLLAPLAEPYGQKRFVHMRWADIRSPCTRDPLTWHTDGSDLH